MKKNRFYFKLLAIVSLLAMSSNLVTAQQDAQLTLYNFDPMYYNPAYAGSKSALSITALGRFQWVNFKGAPNTQFLTVHTPVLGQSLGMGLSLVNDKIGSRKRTAAYYDISTGIRLNNNNDRLAFGISAGVDFISHDFSSLNVQDISDPFYGETFSTTKFNVGAGIYYYNKKFFVGVSSPRLLEPTMKVGDVVNALSTRHFYITGGYVFDLNSVVKFKPTTLIKFTPHAPLTADIDLNFLLYERFWVGALYRFHEAVGLNFVYNINDFFHIGYGYEFPINRLSSYQSGTHEVLLQFNIKSKRNLFTSPRYF